MTVCPSLLFSFLNIFHHFLFTIDITMSTLHDQNKEQLREHLTQAQRLVGEKVEIKEEG